MDVNEQLPSRPAQPAHMAHLLHLALRRLRAEGEAAAIGLGHRPVQAAQARLLDLVPVHGARVSDLAREMRVSKQGIGQLAAQLHALGYVEISPDPADRRAKVVLRTPAGDRFATAVREVLEGVEERWRQEVGSADYAVFRRVLASVAATPGGSSSAATVAAEGDA